MTFGLCSIALFPFWRFDAKRGEVVLVGLPLGFARVGHTHLLYHSLRASVPLCFTRLLLNLFGYGFGLRLNVNVCDD